MDAPKNKPRMDPKQRSEPRMDANRREKWSLISVQCQLVRHNFRPALLFELTAHSHFHSLHPNEALGKANGQQRPHR